MHLSNVVSGFLSSGVSGGNRAAIGPYVMSGFRLRQGFGGPP
jgi:hypothetical protein